MKIKIIENNGTVSYEAEIEGRDEARDWLKTCAENLSDDIVWATPKTVMEWECPENYYYVTVSGFYHIVSGSLVVSDDDIFDLKSFRYDSKTYSVEEL